jgi:hypothetical protein
MGILIGGLQVIGLAQTQRRDQSAAAILILDPLSWIACMGLIGESLCAT